MKKRDLYYERIPTKLLRENVRYLGNILGRVIKEQEGQKFFELVEKIRKLSKANKVNPNINQTNRKVVRAIKNLSPKNSYKITRAFTHFMNFMNLAELIDASRKLNEYENNKKKTSNSNLFIEEIFEDLFNNKSISETKIYNTAKNLKIGVVLTAHPTEVKRRTLIQKYHNIIEILEQIKKLYNKYDNAFSYFINQSQTHYYGAKISQGENRADIHGSLLCLWAVLMILESLDLKEEKLKIIKP